jgi:hypothetical protein
VNWAETLMAVDCYQDDGIKGVSSAKEREMKRRLYDPWFDAM